MTALSPRKEPKDLLPGHGGLNPVDVFIPSWTNWMGTCLDKTVMNPLQTATLRQCAEEGDNVVKLAHRNKLKLYQALCTSEGLAFSPLAVDTFGGWHKKCPGCHHLARDPAG